MGRIVVVAGPPELGAHPALRDWGYRLLHKWFCNEPRESIVVGRMASPAEHWAHDMGRTCGLHVYDIRTDGVRWSSRIGQHPWCDGGCSLSDASEAVAASVGWHIRQGWTARLYRLEVEGVPWSDPLLPMLARHEVSTITESVSLPLGWRRLVPCMP